MPLEALTAVGAVFQVVKVRNVLLVQRFGRARTMSVTAFFATKAHT